MFSWVCPRCGRENSPSYIECPDCKERDAQARAEAEAQAPPLPQPAMVPQYQNPNVTQEWQVPYQPPQAPPAYVPQPPQPQYAQPPQPPPQYVQQPPQYAPQPPYAPPAPQQYAQPQYAPQPPAQPQYPQPPQPPPQFTQTQPVYAPPQQYAPQQPQYAPQPPQQQAPQYPPQTPPQPPQYAPPPQQYAPPAPPPVPKPAPAPVPVAAPKPKPPSTPLPPEPVEQGFGARLAALPAPLLMLLFAVVFLLVGSGLYFGYQRFFKGSSAGDAAAASIVKKPKEGKETNPIQKYVEVVGIRLTSDAKKNPVAKFVIVNHASTELNNLGAIVTLWASTSRSEEDSVGSFAFTGENIGPYQSKEVSAPFKTKLKIYELPDWQNATPEIQITSPQP